MTKPEEATAISQQGYGCAQVMFTVFAPDLGIDRDTALRLSKGFGTGMSQTDNMSGALSSAVMVIGLRYASPRADDTAAREKTFAAVAELLQEFEKLHGSITCTDLLGYNMSDPQQRAEAAKDKDVPTRCPAFILDTIKLVENVV